MVADWSKELAAFIASRRDVSARLTRECIESQQEAAYWGYEARYNLEVYNIRRAAGWQRESAYHSLMAWYRLADLLDLDRDNCEIEI